MRRPRARLRVLIESAALALLLTACAIHAGQYARRNEAIDKELDLLINKSMISFSHNSPWLPSRERLMPLAAAGREDVPYLILRLRDDDMRVRMYSACALAVIGDTRATQPLIALAEEMRASNSGFGGRLYRKWCDVWGELDWRSSVGHAAFVALAEIKDPAISTYALNTILAMDDWDLFVFGDTYSRMLRAQDIEEDIRRAIDALKDRKRTRGPNANIDAAVETLENKPDPPAEGIGPIGAVSPPRWARRSEASPVPKAEK